MPGSHLSPTVDDLSKAKGQRAGGAKPKSKLFLSKTAVGDDDDDDDASFDLDFGTGYKVQPRAAAATHKLPPATQRVASLPETDEDDTPLARPKPAAVNKAKTVGLAAVRPGPCSASVLDGPGLAFLSPFTFSSPPSLGFTQGCLVEKSVQAEDGRGQRQQ